MIGSPSNARRHMLKGVVMEDPRWVAYAVAAAISAALVAIFGKIGLREVDVTLATALRGSLMALFLLGAAALTGKFQGFSNLSLRGIFFVVLAGIAGALSWWFFFAALARGPAVGVTALDRLSVVFVLLFAALALGEPLTARSALGAALVTAGAVLLALR